MSIMTSCLHLNTLLLVLQGHDNWVRMKALGHNQVGWMQAVTVICKKEVRIKH